MPVVVILLGLGIGTQIEGDAVSHVALIVAEAIGIGLAVGVVLPCGAALLLRWVKAHDWVSTGWTEVPALALACFAVAQELGGSGFIACFTGGLIFGLLVRQDKHTVLRGAENTGETLALLTWMLFGSLVVGQLTGRMSLLIMLYAVLSLTLIRMVPVFLGLLGTSVGPRSGYSSAGSDHAGSSERELI